MSSTRIAEIDAPSRQERFCSSAALSRGLLANVVARRLETLHSPSHRELVCFLQELSLRDPASPHFACVSFPSWPWPSKATKHEHAFDRLAREVCESYLDDADAAEVRGFIERLCLNPAIDPDRLASEHDRAVIAALAAFRSRFCEAYRPRIAATETSAIVFDLLDYASEQGGMVLLEGEYRTGKSFAAQAWCQLHGGGARYVQLASGSSDAEFYRDIAQLWHRLQSEPEGPRRFATASQRQRVRSASY